MASGSQDWHTKVFSELGSGNLVTQKKTGIMVSRKALEFWKQRIPVLLQMENSLDFRERRCSDRSSARVCI
jgi:hypothetical protein